MQCMRSNCALRSPSSQTCGSRTNQTQRDRARLGRGNRPWTPSIRIEIEIGEVVAVLLLVIDEEVEIALELEVPHLSELDPMTSPGGARPALVVEGGVDQPIVVEVHSSTVIEIAIEPVISAVIES